MSGRPRISVAICTRNGAPFIEEQVRSILAQTVPVDELVVSDDASSDGTVELVRAVVDGQPEPRPDLVVLENAQPIGVTANFEQALAACRGIVIALSDQDDVWHPDRIERALAEFDRRPDLLLAHADARLVDGRGDDLHVTLLGALEVSGADLRAIHEGDAFEVFLRRNLATGATMMVRPELIARSRPFPAEWVHDEWLAMIAATSGGLDVIETPLVDYRQHASNQIGAERPTLRRKVRRVLEPRGDRNRRLAARARALDERVARMEGVSPSRREAVHEKAVFETERENYPASRWRRIAPVLRSARRGDYARFAGRGRADVVRDLLQSR